MLTHLQVHDLAIVSHLELECHGGMTALTGETGAGKSILIDALGLVLGDKADVSLIRVGSARAEIVGTLDFDTVPAARDWLVEQALDDDGLCIIRRLIVREGRSRAFINGRPVTGSQLRALGDLLVDIHGQHAHQSLLRANVQRDLLDAYGAHLPVAEATAMAFRAFRALDQQLTELESASQERAARLDLLRFQTEELEALAMTATDIEQFDQEQRRLSHLGHLQESVGHTLQLLSEGEPSIADQLRSAANTVGDLAKIDSELGESRDLLDTAVIHIGEAAAGLRHYLDGLELDPAALAQVEARIVQVHDLARKYRVSPTQLPELLARRQSELTALEQVDVTLDDVRERRAGAWQGFMTHATQLTTQRVAAAQRLSDTVTQAMQTLGMGGGRFSVDCEPLAETRIGAGGLERIDFLVSANPGQPVQPLAKVASGGELSRISLAIQVATTQYANVPTLVFDEVDVGIGGAVAEIVGRLLRRLGETRQVLCVTHLPQVAAQAHQQLRVRKETIDGQTHARIEALNDTARVDEIARMLGGTEITARTRAHAGEMLGWSG